MKQFENIFRILLSVVFGFLPIMTLQAQPEDGNRMDSVEISLITCSPHEEIYSLYGHSAIRYRDMVTGEDMIFNYGIFNFKKPHFALRFVFGLTDYELAIAPTQPFLDYYAHWGSQVTEQVLNLTPEEKQQIISALSINYQPENRVYRYNIFYDNCATRPRNIIERNLSSPLIYNPRTDFEPSFREMVGEKTKHHPWATFGNDILLGIKADMHTSMREQHFLPENLRHDFDHAFIEHDGHQVPFVKERRELIAPGVQTIEEDFPLTPFQCGIILTVLSVAILIYETVRKTTLRWFDALLMLLTGLAGLVLFIMIFSQHPTTSLNLQILLLNPLSLFFIWPAWKGRRTLWFRLNTYFILAFLIGGIWQDYAEGMLFVALCLLLRNWRHYNDK